MKRRTRLFAAASGIGLLLAVGGTSAEPPESCLFDGQTGYSIESMNGHWGYHQWVCSSGMWQYVRYCGDTMCPIT